MEPDKPTGMLLMPSDREKFTVEKIEQIFAKTGDIVVVGTIPGTNHFFVCGPDHNGVLLEIDNVTADDVLETFKQVRSKLDMLPVPVVEITEIKKLSFETEKHYQPIIKEKKKDHKRPYKYHR